MLFNGNCLSGGNYFWRKFHSEGATFRGGNSPRGNSPRGQLSGGQLPGWQFSSGATILGSNCPGEQLCSGQSSRRQLSGGQSSGGQFSSGAIVLQPSKTFKKKNSWELFWSFDNPQQIKAEDWKVIFILRLSK